MEGFFLDPGVVDTEEFLLDPDVIADIDLDCEMVVARALASSDTLAAPLDSVAILLLTSELG